MKSFSLFRRECNEERNIPSLVVGSIYFDER